MPDPTTLAMSRTVTRGTQTRSRPPWAADPAPQGRQGSVFVTGQECSREQRRGRYIPESIDHPGKMLPSIARYLIATYTRAGEPVADPMAGINTTVVEAMHLGPARHRHRHRHRVRTEMGVAGRRQHPPRHSPRRNRHRRDLPRRLPPPTRPHPARAARPHRPGHHLTAVRAVDPRPRPHPRPPPGQGPQNPPPLRRWRAGPPMSAPHDRPPGDRPGRSNRATPQGRVRHHRRGRRRGQAPGRASGQGHPRSPDLVARIQQRPRQPHPTERSPSRLTSGNPTPAMRLTA